MEEICSSEGKLLIPNTRLTSNSSHPHNTNIISLSTQNNNNKNNNNNNNNNNHLIIFFLRNLILCFYLLNSVHALNQPLPRSYHSHAYYVIETYPNLSSHQSMARQLADALHTEFVEQVGELDDFWLVKAPKTWVDRGSPFIDSLSASSTSYHHRRSILDQITPPTHNHHQEQLRDAVIERFQLIKRSIHDPHLESELNQFDHNSHQRRSTQISNRHLIRSIRSIERQVLRKRHKRDAIYVPSKDGSRPIISKDFDPPQTNHQFSYSLKSSNLPRAFSLSQLAANKFNIHDPLWPKQWHLVNDVIPKHMINATGVWDIGITGKNVSVAIVDDGLDMTSGDLKENFFEKGSWDYNDHTPLPEPRLPDDLHGTRCAGEIAAIRNDVCGVGVAYDAKVAGIRILSAPISDADEASALNFGFQENHIYSCSWGPPDDGKSMEAPSRLIFKAMLNGIQKGRGGKGSVFVFASGNGGAVDDQCNFDGYTNSIYSITISAIDRQGLHPYYSEFCSANMAVTYSSGSGDNIHTTDVGKNKCTDRHGGTSAAAPLGAGIYALVLEARPDLTWRDVQYLTVQTAIPFNLDDSDWQRTSTGRLYNHKFGFGNLDAYHIVQAAKIWKLVKPQAWWTSPNVNAHSQPVTSTGANATIVVTQADLDRSNFDSLEHITVAVNIKHGKRGNVRVLLVSPHGTVSILATHRRYDDASTGFPGWVFMTVKHWGENAVGAWTLSVQDPYQEPDKNGTFEDWAIGIWGECKDPNIQELFKMPDDAEIVLPPSPVSGVALETIMPQYVSSVLAQSGSPTPFPLASDIGMGSSKTKSYAKPTAHLPIDHAGSIDDTTGDRLSGFGGMTSYLNSKSSWVFIALGLAIILGGVLCGWFFLIRMHRHKTRSRQDGFLHSSHDEENDDYLAQGIGLLSGSSRYQGVKSKLSQFINGSIHLFGAKKADLKDGNGYSFEPVAGEEDLPMRSMNSGPMKNSTSPFNSRLKPSKRTKDLYDAFGHHSDEENDIDNFEDDHGDRVQQEKPNLNQASSTTTSYSDIKMDDEYMDSFLEDEPTPLDSTHQSNST